MLVHDLHSCLHGASKPKRACSMSLGARKGLLQKSEGPRERCIAAPERLMDGAAQVGSDVIRVAVGRALHIWQGRVKEGKGRHEPCPTAEVGCRADMSAIVMPRLLS